nr:hypothetical protein [Tropicibacter sp. Alg240-R139]
MLEASERNRSKILPIVFGAIASAVLGPLTRVFLIPGVVLVEVVFVYPRLGQLLVDSVSKRDISVVQAPCLSFAMINIPLISQPMFCLSQRTRAGCAAGKETDEGCSFNCPANSNFRNHYCSLLRDLMGFSLLIAPYSETAIVSSQFDPWGEAIFLALTTWAGTSCRA